MCKALGRINAGQTTMTGEPQRNPRRRFLVADHVIEHKGDETLFWTGDLQTLCPDHHDITKQQREARGFSDEMGADGVPTDPNHPFNR